MDRKRHVIIVSENPYYRAVFRETLVDAGFSVDDQVTAPGLEERLRLAQATSLLLLDGDLTDTTAPQLLRQIYQSGVAPPNLRTVCLVDRNVNSYGLGELKDAGFSGIIPLNATPELIVFRVNDLIFSEEVKQRRNLRAPVSITAEVRLGNELVKGMIVSLSKHGLFLKSKQPMEVNRQIELTFTLPPDSRGAGRRLTVPGRVTLVKGKTGPEDIYFGPGMVVIFDNPNTSMLELLDEFVAGELDKL